MSGIHDWLQPLPRVAILRGLHPDEAVDIGQAIADAGFRVPEVPLNSPDPMQSISRMAGALDGRCLVGAGTVMTPDQVDSVAEVASRARDFVRAWKARA